MNSERPRTLQQHIQGLETFIRRQIKWFTWPPIIALFLIAVPNPIAQPIIEAIGHKYLGLAKPSLISLIGVAILFFILQRIVFLENEVHEVKVRDLSLQTYSEKQEAYAELSERVSKETVGKIDLLEFSGTTARGLLHKVAMNSPKVKIRMLLFEPEEADKFDSDPDLLGNGVRAHHSTRIQSTTDDARVVLARDVRERYGSTVDLRIRYYKVMPSVSAVILDNDTVSISWYRCYDEGRAMVLVGHNSATIIGSGDSAAPLRSFAQKHFEALWETTTKPELVP